MSQNALRFYGRVAYDDAYNGLALDDAEGDRMCAQLAAADVIFLASHGVIVTGQTMAAAFDDLYYLERACMLQVMAMGTGRPLRIVTDAVASMTVKQMAQEAEQAQLHFAALKRLLDRDEPGWRTG
jgi:ribulose-5-phosphate 4-epimerase/fuculose-1-phosphate aldolase